MSTLGLRDPSLSLLLWSGIGERSWYLHSYTEKGKTPISLSKWKQALLWAVLCLRMGFKDMLSSFLFPTLIYLVVGGLEIWC